MNKSEIAIAVGLIVLVMVGCSRTPATPLELANQAFLESDWQGTIAICDGIIGEEPDNFAAHLLRGRALLAQGHVDGAIVSYTLAIEADPENPEGYYYRSGAYDLQGKIKLAWKDKELGRELDGSYARAYLTELPSPSPMTPYSDSLAAEKLAEAESEGSEDGDVSAADRAADELFRSLHERMRRRRLKQFGSRPGEETGDSAINDSGDSGITDNASRPLNPYRTDTLPNLDDLRESVGVTPELGSGNIYDRWINESGSLSALSTRPGTPGDAIDGDVASTVPEGAAEDFDPAVPGSDADGAQPPDTPRPELPPRRPNFSTAPRDPDGRFSVSNIGAGPGLQGNPTNRIRSTGIRPGIAAGAAGRQSGAGRIPGQYQAPLDGQQVLPSRALAPVAPGYGTGQGDTAGRRFVPGQFPQRVPGQSAIPQNPLLNRVPYSPVTGGANASGAPSGYRPNWQNRLPFGQSRAPSTGIQSSQSGAGR